MCLQTIVLAVVEMRTRLSSCPQFLCLNSRFIFTVRLRTVTMPNASKLHCGHGPANTFVLCTPIGDYELVCCPRGIHSLNHMGTDELQPDWSIIIGDFSRRVSLLSQLYPDNGYTYKPALVAVDWLQKYFDGPQSVQREVLPPVCHLSQANGKFQQKVWSTLAEQVGFGQTVTYGQLAGLCGSSKAAQAVGQAMRTNPVSIVVPCHRVILSTGRLGNYSGGKKNNLKQFLLQHEGVSAN